MDPYLGQIILFAGDFAPRGWAECNGHRLSTEQNMALYSILGTVYGGDGKTYFNLPKIDAPVSGLRYIIAIQGLFPRRN